MMFGLSNEERHETYRATLTVADAAAIAHSAKLVQVMAETETDEMLAADADMTLTTLHSALNRAEYFEDGIDIEMEGSDWLYAIAALQTVAGDTDNEKTAVLAGHTMDRITDELGEPWTGVSDRIDSMSVDHSEAPDWPTPDEMREVLDR